MSWLLNRMTGWRSSLVVLVMLHVCCSGCAAAASEHAAEFTLGDQFGEVWSHTYPRDRIGVIVFADREGSGRMSAWIELLRERYAGKIEVRGVAVLGEVPGAMRGLVRREFRKRYRTPVLLDWGGKVAERFGYVEGHVAVWLVDCDGTRLWQWSGGVDDTAVEEFCRETDRALARTVHGFRIKVQL
jgi:hypothetical protein